MPTDLIEVMNKLGDKNVQARLSNAIHAATISQLKTEGIELSPHDWGELVASVMAAKGPGGKIPQVGWGDVITGLNIVFGGALTFI
jgi:hypothetical protein